MPFSASHEQGPNLLASCPRTWNQAWRAEKLTDNYIEVLPLPRMRKKIHITPDKGVQINTLTTVLFKGKSQVVSGDRPLEVRR